MADGLSIPDLRGRGLPPILLKSNCKAVYGAGEVSQKLIQRLQVSHTTVVLHQHIYQALQILFRAIVPRRGLFRNELRYFDSFRYDKYIKTCKKLIYLYCGIPHKMPSCFTVFIFEMTSHTLLMLAVTLHRLKFPGSDRYISAFP